MNRHLLCVGGTLLPAASGPRPVEALAIGDVLHAGDGTPRTLRWIGRTRLMPAELAGRPQDWPVHVAAGALADGLPPRDLVVLPTHLLLVPGLPPVAAEWLVDGRLVDRPEPTAPLDIFALQLDPPGLPGVEGVTNPADLATAASDALVRAVRLAIASRVGGGTLGVLRGALDAVTHRRVGGWAADGGVTPVAVEILVNGVPRPPLPARRYRRDLEQAGIAAGRAGFLLHFDPPLDPAAHHLISVRRAADGAELPGSPVLLDAAMPPALLVARLAPEEDARPPVEALVRGLAARVRGGG